MFDIEKAISLSKEYKDLSRRINEEADKLEGFIGIDDYGRIHIRESCFDELFHGEYDREIDMCVREWPCSRFEADADGATFFCVKERTAEDEHH